MFDWGTITRHDEDNPITFKGKEISTIFEDGRFKVRLAQPKFISALEPSMTGSLQFAVAGGSNKTGYCECGITFFKGSENHT